MSGKSALAWLVHALTASGAVLALFAWAAVDRGEARVALLWLLTALAVDGVDGTLARRLRVDENAPRVDGAVLDLVIDYLTYVFIPTLLIWRTGLVLPQWAPYLAAAIQLSSLYVFARRDMKTQDGYFRGFPALWNLVAFYLVVGAPGPEMSSSEISYMGIPLLAGGAFPVEIALSLAGMVFVLRRRLGRPHYLYLIVLAAAALSFTAAFKGQIAASIVFARYLVPFVMVALPYAGGLIAQPLTAPHERRPLALGALVVLLAALTFSLSRAFNYPAQFPADAISAGWTIRTLQESGTISPSGKILIERAEDWGDLGVVALANRPERFVVLNELAYRQTALWRKSANRPAPIPRRIEDGVRGTVCGNEFQDEPCRTSVMREGFELAVLSSPERAASFGKAFQTRSWVVGRYHLFDLKTEPARASPPADR